MNGFVISNVRKRYFSQIVMEGNNEVKRCRSLSTSSSSSRDAKRLAKASRRCDRSLERFDLC